MMKECTACHLSLPATEEHFYKAKNRWLIGECKKCHYKRNRLVQRPEYHLAYRRRVRREALVKYSQDPPDCKCCGEGTEEFLGIDHVHGKGGQHRKAIKAQGFTIELWLRKMNYPSGFQVLCHNCNLAKGFYGVCPHQQTMSKAI